MGIEIVNKNITWKDSRKSGEYDFYYKDDWIGKVQCFEKSDNDDALGKAALYRYSWESKSSINQRWGHSGLYPFEAASDQFRRDLINGTNHLSARQSNK